MTELITSFMELTIMLILIGGFTKNNFFSLKKSPLFLIFIIIKVFFVFLSNVISDEFISFSYNSLLILLIIKSYYNLRITETIFSFLCSYIIIVVFQVPYVFFYTRILNMTNQDILAISCMLLCIVIANMINIFIPTYKLFDLIFKKNNLGILIISNFFAIAVIISMYFKVNRARFIDMIIFFIITLLILISINIVAITQFNTIRKQRKQLAAYEEYFPMIEALILTVRRRQHHHSNEIQAIMSLMYTHKDYDSLVNAISEHFELSKTLDMPAYLLKLNMKMVAGFLYMKEQEAASCNKFLKIHANTFDLTSKVPEYILVELFGILIDNGLEAIDCGEAVFVTLDSRDDKIIFKTRNKGFKLLSEHRTRFFTPGYSTKNSGFIATHSGLGLPTLKNIVIDQYQGRILADNEGPDNDIVFQITL